MHDFAELIFHAVISLLRALWAVCEFVVQFVGETATESMSDGRFRNRKPSGPPMERIGADSGYKE